MVLGDGTCRVRNDIFDYDFVFFGSHATRQTACNDKLRSSVDACLCRCRSRNCRMRLDFLPPVGKCVGVPKKSIGSQMPPLERVLLGLLHRHILDI